MVVPPLDCASAVWIQNDLEPTNKLAQYEEFSHAFDPRFRSGNHNVASTAQQYLFGLMQAEKRNMERMAEAVPDSDEQVLQNFLTHSAWEYRGVMDQVAINADLCVGGEVGAGLYVDESAFQKKGEKSLGVAR